MKQLRKAHLVRLHKVLGLLVKGLETRRPAAHWGDNARTSYRRMLARHGLSLVTRTQAEKRGYRLKRGAQPVATGYFGAICKDAGLYVLELQAVRVPTEET